MGTAYNQISGRSLERLAALSDGVFAVAMTLLVLDLHVPLKESVHSERDLLDALGLLLPRVVPYVMSFITLGIFWTGQQTQLNHFSSSNRHLTWIHLAFLFIVTLVPFSTNLLAEFITYRTALLMYWLNIVALGIVVYWSWSYAHRNHLMKQDVTPEIAAALRHRVIVAQTLYAIGAALCIISTTLSIGLIFLIQLYYAIAPRLGTLSKKLT